MLAIEHWPLAARRRITGILTDIDDTLTTEGAITPDALAALSALQAAGLDVIAITGRPVGWSEPFARAWPVDAIVAENGAVALLPDKKQGFRKPGMDSLLSKIYLQDQALRAVNFTRLQAVLARVERELPGVRRAGDSAGRETDIAIDHSEFARLEPAQIAAVVALMRSEGLQATVSSIHINGWIGQHNKLEGARWSVQELLGRSLALEMADWVYVGDSPNDQVMFQAFANSVGVANVRRFEAQLTSLPTYVTVGERGAGFSEVATAILAARRG